MPGTYHVKASHASWSFENVSIYIYIHINFSHYTPFCTSIIIDFLDCIILFTKYKIFKVQDSLFVSAVFNGDQFVFSLKQKLQLGLVMWMLKAKSLFQDMTSR